MLRSVAKLAAVGLLSVGTLIATSDDASARNRGRWGGGYGVGAPVVRYYGGPRAYGGYYGGYAPRAYSNYYSPYGNQYYGNRYYNNGYYGNRYYGNNYYGNGYYNGGYYGNGYYAPRGNVGVTIGW